MTPHKPTAACGRTAGTQWTVAVLLVTALCGMHVEAGVAVSPMQQQVRVEPGGSSQFTITLSNVRRSTDQAPARVRLSVTGFSVDKLGNLDFAAEREHVRSAADWIHLDATDFEVAPGDSRCVTGTVTAPPAADGDYWSAVMLTLGDGPSGGPGVNVVLRTASGVFVRVARRQYATRPAIGELAVAAPLVGDDASSVPGAAGPPSVPALSISAEVANEGLLYFRAKASAYVYLDGRRRVAEIPLHSPRPRVLPGHVRSFVGMLPAPLPAGDYVVRCIVEAEGDMTKRTFREARFRLDERDAADWSRQSGAAGSPGVEVQPTQISQVLTPGRLTACSITVRNHGLGTVRVRCSVPGRTPLGDWLTFSRTEFTLGPGNARAVACNIRVPRDAEPGVYAGTVEIEVDGAKLVDDRGPEQREIPVRFEVQEAR